MTVLVNVNILMDVNGFHTFLIPETAIFSRIAQYWMKPLKGPQLAKLTVNYLLQVTQFVYH
jgi:hypothetical protein